MQTIRSYPRDHSCPRGRPPAIVVTTTGAISGNSVDVPVKLVGEIQIDKQRLVLAERPGDPPRGLRAVLQRLV